MAQSGRGPEFSKVKYDWRDAGEEWSESWGTSAAQWSGAILPRIQGCLPTGTILEIGPGFGRWTNYLKDSANIYGSLILPPNASKPVAGVSRLVRACAVTLTMGAHCRCFLTSRSILHAASTLWCT